MNGHSTNRIDTISWLGSAIDSLRSAGSRCDAQTFEFVLESLEDRLLLSGTPIEIAPFGPGQIIDVNGFAYFGGGGELQRSDGTAAGTVQLTDWNPGGAAEPTLLAELNGTIFFKQNAGTTGSELQKSDGTVGGAVLVKDISPGSASSYISYVTATDNYIYFVSTGNTTDSVETGKELWRSDGTPAGTFMLKDIGPGSTGGDIHDLTAAGDKLFFAADDGTHGRELWVSDGTAVGTKMVRDINPNSASSSPGQRAESGSQITEFNGQVLFAASSGALGRELWRSDGTSGGTQQVADIRSGTYNGSSPTSITEFDGMVYFAARGDSGTNGLWKSNGIAGATLVKEGFLTSFNVGPASQLTAVNDKLFFTAHPENDGRVLWVSDGTTAGTKILKDHNGTAGGSDTLRQFTPLGGKLYYYRTGTSSGDPAGSEIWESDGTAAGTHVAFDLTPGPGGSPIGTMTNVSGSLFFIADLNPSPFVSSTLWRYTDPITVFGTTGDDTVNVSFSANNISVSINGSSNSYPLTSIGGIEIRGLGGADQITIVGSSQPESSILKKGELTFKRRGYEITTVSIETATIIGGVGDSTLFRDSTGNDTFVASPTSAVLSGAGFRNSATGFDRVDASSSGGTDRAALTGSSGNDQFTASSTAAVLSGAGFRNSATGFDRVDASSSGGNDAATLSGSAGNDTLTATATSAALSGAGFRISAAGFERVSANGLGGKDAAVLNGTAGKDTFNSSRALSVLFGAKYRNAASGFESVNANGLGGKDKATLKGSSGNDKLVANPKQTVFSGANFRDVAVGFERVVSIALNGNDKATLKDSSGNDRFQATSKSAFLQGRGFVNIAKGFDSVTARASGGKDTAVLVGTNGKDTIRGNSKQTSLKGSGFLNNAIKFDRVIANGGKGNDLAVLNDSAGNDRLVSKSKVSTLSSNAFSIRVRNVETLTVIASAGGKDVAVMNDTTGNDTYKGRGVNGELRGKGFSNKIKRFETVTAFSSKGKDKLDIANLKYTFKQVGPWIDV